MSHEIARWLVALGSVTAWVGFTVLGMGMSFVESVDWMITLGLVLTVGGVVALVAGAYVYRTSAEPGSAAARRSSDRG
jgi:hypothetical protein